MHWIDPDHLPETRGIVRTLVLNPHGLLDGLLLDDDTEIHVAPHLSGQLLPRIRPGEQVTVRGLRHRGIPLIVALAVTPARGRTVVDEGPGHEKLPKHLEGKRERWGYSGVVERLLHGPKGDIHGALLDDGVILRFPPHAAQGVKLREGQAVDVEGAWFESRHGTVIDVDHLATAGRPLMAVR